MQKTGTTIIPVHNADNDDVRRMVGYHRPKQAWLEMGYLMCLNMSATFPFTWKESNLEGVNGVVLGEVKSLLQGLRGLSGPGEKPGDWNLKKCLLQMTQPRAPRHSGCVWGCELKFGGGTVSPRESTGTASALLLFLWLTKEVRQ